MSALPPKADIAGEGRGRSLQATLEIVEVGTLELAVPSSGGRCK
jgi:hypothetical protein